MSVKKITITALETALKDIMRQTPFEKITVSDITNRCQLNRQTFYYHFQDIYDLVEWACLEDAKKALENKKTHDTWQQGFISLLYAVRENKPFIINVYHCVDKAQVEKYLTPLTDDLLLGVVEEESQAMTVREEDKKFIADRKSTRLNSSHVKRSRMPSSA